MQSFRILHFPSLQWPPNHGGADFSEPLDLFHLPYPWSRDGTYARLCANTRYRTQHAGPLQSSSEGNFGPETTAEEQSQTDVPILSKLPPEIATKIFGCLSVPALDAARYTCKAWWTWIQSPAVLSTALDKSLSLAPRSLSLAFEETARLPAVYDHPDSWRTRFVAHGVTLQMPLVELGSPICGFETACLTPDGKLSILQVSGTKATTLVFYNLDTNETPIYVGHSIYPFAKKDCQVHHATEAGNGQNRLIALRSDAQIHSYALKPKDAFSRDQCPYNIESLGTGKVPYESDGMPDDTEHWRFLAPIALDEISKTSGVRPENAPFPQHDPRLSKLASQQRGGPSFHKASGCHLSYFLTENISTGELNVVCSASQNDWRERTYRGLVSLSLPRAGIIYRNVAVANVLVHDVQKAPVIRIAVIWSDKTIIPPETTSEVYIYELPIAPLTDEKHSEPFSPPRIQAKRITSLPPYFGGLHPKSPILRQSTAHNNTPEASILTIIKSLGGLHFPGKLHIWGPPSRIVSSLNHCSEIHIRIFDFSYADPARLALSFPWLRKDGGRTDLTTETYFRRKMVGSRMENCACELHDEGWTVVLPRRAMPSYDHDDERKAPPSAAKLTGQGLWPWSHSTPNKEDDASSVVGTIYKADSKERVEALERREAWLKRRIVGMKASGIDDMTLKNIWGNADWSGWGLLARPRGWEGLWRQWAREMGVALAPSNR